MGVKDEQSISFTLSQEVLSWTESKQSLYRDQNRGIASQGRKTSLLLPKGSLGKANIAACAAA